MKKFLKISALIVALLVGALLLALNTVALRVTRSQLAANLQAPATLDGLSLSLLSGTAELRGLKIGQPGGFGEGDALSVGRVKVDVDVSSLLGGGIRVESVQVEDPVIHLVVNADKSINLAALARPRAAGPAPVSESSAPPAVLLQALALHHGVFRVTDHTRGTNAVEIVVTNLAVNVGDLQLGPDAPGQPEEGSALVSFDLVQKSGTNAAARLAARIAPVRPGVEPTLAAAVRVAGFELGTLGRIPGDSTIGQSIGYGFDIRIDVATAPGLLSAEGTFVNEYGQQHDLLKASGSLSKPEVQINSLLTGVIALPGKMLTAAAGNAVEAGEKAVVAVAETGEAVVAGALNTVGSLAGGLLSSGEKLLKGDVTGAGGELVKGVEDSASTAEHTVSGAGATMVDGVAAAASTAVGGEQMGKWRAGFPARSAELFAAADRKLAAEAFPPVKQP